MTHRAKHPTRPYSDMSKEDKIRNIRWLKECARTAGQYRDGSEGKGKRFNPRNYTGIDSLQK